MIHATKWKNITSPTGGVVLTTLVFILIQKYLMKGMNQNAEKKNIGRAYFGGYGNYIGGGAGVRGVE